MPSATTCKVCHPDHYREWSVSAHAYAQMSPVFNAMHGKILKLTNGTNGDFCIRCHTPVGMNLQEPEFISNLERHPTSREGITCIACHRLDQAYGKLSGRLAIVEGDIFDPVYGPSGNEELNRVIRRQPQEPSPEQASCRAGAKPVTDLLQRLVIREITRALSWVPADRRLLVCLFSGCYTSIQQLWHLKRCRHGLCPWLQA